MVNLKIKIKTNTNIIANSLDIFLDNAYGTINNRSAIIYRNNETNILWSLRSRRRSV